jgi:hypothetical protein
VLARVRNAIPPYLWVFLNAFRSHRSALVSMSYGYLEH